MTSMIWCRALPLTPASQPRPPLGRGLLPFLAAGQTPGSLMLLFTPILIWVPGQKGVPTYQHKKKTKWSRNGSVFRSPFGGPKPPLSFLKSIITVDFQGFSGSLWRSCQNSGLFVGQILLDTKQKMQLALLSSFEFFRSPQLRSYLISKMSV